MGFIKTKISNEVKKFVDDTNWFDRIFILVARCMLLYSAISLDGSRVQWLVFVHFFSTFPIEVIHMLTPKKSFFNKISYSVNTYACLMLVAGSFFGHYYSLYQFIPKYDWVLHLVSGFVSVFIGYYVLKPLLTPKNKTENQIVGFFGFTFASFGMVLWEVFEFVFDYILGSNNQRFDYVPNPDMWLFKLIGLGKTTEAHYPMFDTMFDTCFALFGSIVATVLLYTMLANRIRAKKTIEIDMSVKEDKEEVTVK